MDKIDIINKRKTAKINNALGVFIALFGLIVLAAMAYTETSVQLLTDMVAGLVLVSIGGGMIWVSRRSIKKMESENEQ
ncbi:hypothetical protein [Pseudozobellia thermophila]|uniref:Uncharacterized protein n=1 Tax=Pseudozobellia thermophila TaxID=192903 RepID=A0A1M6I3D7_9FLAO|nr:hypothetical protein [Pseudozobellia thermophila]SHJ28938.1 hypothetical protein SAMN04488513_103310 [Pseudozobellia thermophila]